MGGIQSDIQSIPKLWDEPENEPTSLLGCLKLPLGWVAGAVDKEQFHSGEPFFKDGKKLYREYPLNDSKLPDFTKPHIKERAVRPPASQDLKRNLEKLTQL